MECSRRDLIEIVLQSDGFDIARWTRDCKYLLEVSQERGKILWRIRRTGLKSASVDGEQTDSRSVFYSLQTNSLFRITNMAVWLVVDKPVLTEEYKEPADFEIQEKELRELQSLFPAETLLSQRTNLITK